jgi:hypothetical protein
LKDSNFEIVAAAQDSGGEAAAGSWYDAAAATFTALVDVWHTVSSAFHLTNVPMGVWLDERGRLVRPPEPAWTSTRMDVFGGKPLSTDGEAYVAALRDWVLNGEASRFALSDDEFARRARSQSPGDLEAEATFKLAVWLHRSGNEALAARHFERAQALKPDDWNYHRQQWSFGPRENARARWLEKFLAARTPYYPKLEL